MKMYGELSKKVFPDLNVAVLHGRLEPDLKEQVMRLFQQGKIHILVSTTVIEVGVDVPNATAMVIEHAERFGLSQLHQLRGRIGRGAAKSYCVRSEERRVGVDCGSGMGAGWGEKGKELGYGGGWAGTREDWRGRGGVM